MTENKLREEVMKQCVNYGDSFVPKSEVRRLIDLAIQKAREEKDKEKHKIELNCSCERVIGIEVQNGKVIYYQESGNPVIENMDLLKQIAELKAELSAANIDMVNMVGEITDLKAEVERLKEELAKKSNYPLTYSLINIQEKARAEERKKLLGEIEKEMENTSLNNMTSFDVYNKFNGLITNLRSTKTKETKT